VRAFAVLLLSSLLMIGGCATKPDIDYAPLYSQLLVGKHIDVAIRLFGYPDDVVSLDSRTIYVWVHKTTYTTTTDNYTTREGIRIYQGTDSDTLYLSCTLKIITNASKIIIDWQWEGNAGACAHFNRIVERATAPPKAK
jgi:hypothetical protein